MSQEKDTVVNLIKNVEAQISNVDSNEIDLFAEDIEDRFNAKAVSSGATASSVGGTWGTISTICSFI